MISGSTCIYFHYLIKPFYFPQRELTKSFITSIFADFSKKIETVNYVFCTDKYLLTMNETHLKHNYYTDIITFDLSIDELIIADVFISVERAKENAASFKVTLISEIIRLLIHGALHLCGHKDKTVEDSHAMRTLENNYLSQFWVSRETDKEF